MKPAMITLEVLLTLVTIIAITFVWARGCSNNETKFSRKGNVVKNVCGDKSLGDVREQSCKPGESGKLLEVCTEDGWSEGHTSCTGGTGPVPECDETTFQDIKPILTEKCVSCHPGYDQYAATKQKLDAFITRMELDEGDPKAMPPSGPLLPAEIARVKSFRADGALERCDNDSGVNYFHMDLRYVETNIVNDLNSQDPDDQPFLRYMVNSHRFNLKPDRDEIDQFTGGVNKGINSLSQQRRITRAEPIDGAGQIFRIDLRDYGLDANDWAVVENFDEINFVSQTGSGLLIQFLTQTLKPWMHTENFNFTANQPDVYYFLLGVPRDINVLFDDLGVDFNGDIDNGQARFVGFNGSSISLNKPRLLAGFDSDDGYFWITLDTDLNNLPDDARNLFENPLLNGVAVKYVFDAAELIWSLPNGLQGYALFDAAGNRANAAPQTIVQDDQAPSPFSDEIVNAFSCHRCHNQGLIPAQDQILDHVVRNASQFDINDREDVEDLYGNDPAFDDDQRVFVQALGETGSGVVDPISFGMDRLRKDWNVAEVAALLFLTEAEFRQCLNGSAGALAEIGQLLTGGTVTFGQLVDTLPIILQDCQIGQD